MISRSLPHARGGVSQVRLELLPLRHSSPRTWGCFLHFRHTDGQRILFPTHVGVFLRYFKSQSTFYPLPHARGGVSKRRSDRSRTPGSSPRTWGCFPDQRRPVGCPVLFPTHVGVFPDAARLQGDLFALPHVRGVCSKRARGSFGSPFLVWKSEVCSSSPFSSDIPMMQKRSFGAG